MSYYVAVPMQEYQDFRKDYYALGMNETLRFGQAFANKFFPAGYSDPTLYYQNSDSVSEAYILDHYIDYDN